MTNVLDKTRFLVGHTANMRYLLPCNKSKRSYIKDEDTITPSMQYSKVVILTTGVATGGLSKHDRTEYRNNRW
jgi:hypothetical protein